MREGDKSCSTTIVRLTRSRNKVVINELKFYQELIGKFYKIGKCFSMISNNTMRYDDIQKKHSDNISLKSIVDLKNTHIASVRMLVKDCLRIKLDVWHYEIEYDIAVPYCPILSEWK